MYIKLFKDESSTPEDINQTLTNYHNLISYHEKLPFSTDKQQILGQLYEELNIFLDEISIYSPFEINLNKTISDIRESYIGYIYNLGVLMYHYKVSKTYRREPIVR